MLLDVESRAGEHFDKYVRQFNLGLRVVKSQSVSGVEKVECHAAEVFEHERTNGGH